MAWVISRFAKCSLKPLTGFGFRRGMRLISRFSQMMCAVVSSIKAYSVAPVSTRALTVFLLLLLNKVQGVTRDSEANESFCQAWRRWNQQQISHRDFSEGYLFFDNSVASSSWIRAAFRAWASLLFEQVTDICLICLHRKYFPWAHSCSRSAAVVFVVILEKEFNQVTSTASTAVRVRHVAVMIQEVFIESLNLLMLKGDSFWSFCR